MKWSYISTIILKNVNSKIKLDRIRDKSGLSQLQNWTPSSSLTFLHRSEACTGSKAKGSPSAKTGEFQSPLSSSCLGKVDEPSFYVSPYELNANSISHIKPFKPSHQFSFHRRVEQANRKMF